MKIMLITGGSRGIGAATALLAAEQGFAVGINYLNNKNAADAVVNQIREKGGRAVTIQADVSKEAEIIRLFEKTDALLGRITALVNNAGILERQSRLEDMDAARLERIFSANVTGTFICCREAIRRMSLKFGGTGGTIVNLSSIAARLGAPGEYIDYAASKGAVDSLTIGLAKEVAAEGIRVNAVRPGLIYTDIHASGGEAGRVDRLKANVPMQRGGYAPEVAEAILWLSTEKSSYTTGSFIEVTGGR